MWIYEKRLIYPVKIKRPNARMAKLIAMLYAGANGELTAGVTYLNQRYYMPDDTCKAILTDIGTEELAHWEMLGAMLTQCLDGASEAELRAANMDGWIADHGISAFPRDCFGNSWTADYVGCTGDPIADITNNMAAEQKARAGYEGVLKQCEDADLIAPLEFLRAREIVHFQRFGEALNILNNKYYN